MGSGHRRALRLRGLRTQSRPAGHRLLPHRRRGGNGLKLLFKRPQPRHRITRRPYVSRSAFPSGHGAAEVAFAFAVGWESPLLFLPIAALAMLAHWSLVRERKHYVSDMLVGGTIGLLIAVAAGQLRASGSDPRDTEPDE